MKLPYKGGGVALFYKDKHTGEYSSPVKESGLFLAEDMNRRMFLYVLQPRGSFGKKRESR